MTGKTIIRTLEVRKDNWSDTRIFEEPLDDELAENEVLLKVDRASMYHSLEVRVPFLDREVIDIAVHVDWQSCLDMNQGKGKLPLRHSLAKHVKHQTVTKRGFSVPMNHWLRGPLRPIFEEKVLNQKDILGLEMDQKRLKKIFAQHLSGHTDCAWGLWILLSLALWKEKHFPNG